MKYLACAFVLVATVVFAKPFNYQGKITDASGVALVGNYDIALSVWNAASGGVLADADTLHAIAVERGLFSANFDLELADSLANRVLWTEVSFFAEGSWQTLTPRTKLTYSPFSIFAQHAIKADTATFSRECFRNLVTVAHAGGDFTTIADAMSYVATEGGSTWTVLVLPGAYYETRNFTVPAYVELQGSGANATSVFLQGHTVTLNGRALMSNIQFNSGTVQLRNNNVLTLCSFDTTVVQVLTGYNNYFSRCAFQGDAATYDCVVLQNASTGCIMTGCGAYNCRRLVYSTQTFAVTILNDIITAGLTEAVRLTGMGSQAVIHSSPVLGSTVYVGALGAVNIDATTYSTIGATGLTGSATVQLLDAAAFVGYNNTASGLAAQTVQAALDELAAGSSAGFENDFVQNQNTTRQDASFWISDSGIFGGNAHVDTLYREGFNSVTAPAGWTVDNLYSALGGDPVSLTFVLTSTYPSGIVPVEGTRMAVFNSHYSAATSTADLHQTTPFSATGKNSLTVNFNYYHTANPLELDTLIVKFSTNGTVWVPVETLVTYSTTAGWKPYSITLPASADNAANVYLRFCFVSAHGADQHLDNLVVTGKSGIDHARVEIFDGNVIAEHKVVAPNVVSTITLRQGTYHMDNIAHAILPECGAIFRGTDFSFNGEVEIKLVIRITDFAGNFLFSLGAKTAAATIFPITDADSWFFEDLGGAWAFTSGWVRWNSGDTLRQIDLYGRSDGHVDFDNAYMLVRAHQ